MDWLFQPLPRTPVLFLSASLAVVVLLLALTRLRRTRLAPLAAANLALIVMWGAMWGVFEPSPWRTQVVVMRFMELPVVCGIAVLCVAQAGRLTPSEYRLRRALRAAPALLGCAWVLAFAGELAWPEPSLDPFAEMPVRNWALLTALCVPFQSYIWLLTFLFARAAGPRSPTRRLRAQNFFLAVAVGGYALSSVNVLIGYAVLAFLENPARREATLVQFLVEDRLFLVWAPALLLGLVLAALPAAAASAAQVAEGLTVIPLRERFEGLAWRLEAGGALKRLTRPLHHLRVAARNLGLPETDAAKATQAVKLAAIMSSPKAPADLSRERAGDLLARLEASGVSRNDPPALRPTGRDEPAFEAGNPAHLSEVLDAALELSVPTANPVRARPPAWFELARAACVDAGIASTGGMIEYPGYEKARGAYREAAELARGA